MSRNNFCNIARVFSVLNPFLSCVFIVSIKINPKGILVLILASETFLMLNDYLAVSNNVRITIYKQGYETSWLNFTGSEVTQNNKVIKQY